MQQMQRQAQQASLGYYGISRVLLFCERLTSLSSTIQAVELDHWQDFINEWFTPDAIFSNHLWDSLDESGKFWELPQPALGRYFWTQANGGVSRMQISISGAQQRDLQVGSIVESPSLSVTYFFDNGVRLVSSGTLKALVGQSSRFEWMEIYFSKNEEFIPSELIRQRFQPSSPLQTKSPKMTKTPSKQKKAQSETRSATITETDVPRAPIGNQGVVAQCTRFLEVSSRAMLGVDGSILTRCSWRRR